MKNFGKIKLTEKDNLLSDSEMKTITGGYSGNGCRDTQSQCFGGCSLPGFNQDGTCTWYNSAPNLGENFRCVCQYHYA